MKLSIVIPCYNEAENLSLIAEKFKAVIKRNDVEVIIVNNGSTDESQEILQRLAPRYPFLKIVKVEVNQGYGFGILSGLKEAKGEYIGWMHGDLQTPPADALRTLEIIENRGNPKNIYIKGLRKGRSLPDQFFTFGMSLFEFVILGVWLTDVNAQPNIFHRSFFETWQNPPHDFALDLYAFYLAQIAQKQQLQVVRFPVAFPKRIHGQSHWNRSFADRLKFIKRTIAFSRNLSKGKGLR